jgi:hypothetical protein
VIPSPSPLGRRVGKRGHSGIGELRPSPNPLPKGEGEKYGRNSHQDDDGQTGTIHDSRTLDTQKDTRRL